ncbi:MAG: Gfo/Idh/MocA family oxidoreductase [bacterium]|jgi:predicted dehydrogenase|nr:Gfo/Idh/MocA family oxidoreductase [bacterium]
MLETKENNRRAFMQSTAAAGLAAFTILAPRQVWGLDQNSKIQLGIIGCGGRGQFDGRNLLKTGKVKIIALADYFADQAQAMAQTFEVPEERLAIGIDGYQALCESPDLDAVLLTAAPYFRPMQFEAAIKAGKHVFAEKPIAVDGWGCQKFLEVGKAAQEKQRVVGAGLQTRFDSARQAIAERIQAGAIGKLLVGHSTRMGGDLWRRKREPGYSERDYQVRNWLYYTWACGDFITEMHIHNLDVFNWFTGLLPVSATATAGRQARLDVGDIYDHIQVLYEYPDGFSLSHTGTQIQKGYEGSTKQIVGTEGYYDEKTGLVAKDGEKLTHESIQETTEIEMRQFVEAILGERPYMNQTEYVTTSTFTCILGRMAAKAGRKVTWDEAWDSAERLEPPTD